MEKKKYIIVVLLVFCFNGIFPVKCYSKALGYIIIDKVDKKSEKLTPSALKVVRFDSFKKAAQGFKKRNQKGKRKGLKPWIYFIVEEKDKKNNYSTRDVFLFPNPFLHPHPYISMAERGPPQI